jgi:hypothetical protein
MIHYERGHIHLYDLMPYLREYSDKQFILIHSGGKENFESLDLVRKSI